ncbi:MAG: hypothetical protein ABEK59_03575 [Halobacteria archaeon]
MSKRGIKVRYRCSSCEREFQVNTSHDSRGKSCSYCSYSPTTRDELWLTGIAVALAFLLASLLPILLGFAGETVFKVQAGLLGLGIAYYIYRFAGFVRYRRSVNSGSIVGGTPDEFFSNSTGREKRKAVIEAVVALFFLVDVMVLGLTPFTGVVLAFGLYLGITADIKIVKLGSNRFGTRKHKRSGIRGSSKICKTSRRTGYSDSSSTGSKSGRNSNRKRRSSGSSVNSGGVKGRLRNIIAKLSLPSPTKLKPNKVSRVRGQLSQKKCGKTKGGRSRKSSGSSNRNRSRGIGRRTSRLKKVPRKTGGLLSSLFGFIVSVLRGVSSGLVTAGKLCLLHRYTDKTKPFYLTVMVILFWGVSYLSGVGFTYLTTVTVAGWIVFTGAIYFDSRYLSDRYGSRTPWIVLSAICLVPILNVAAGVYYLYLRERSLTTETRDGKLNIDRKLESRGLA